MEKTASLRERNKGSTFAKLAVGLLAGWLVIQLLNRAGWLVALLLVLAIAILLIDLNSYHAWLLMLVASMASGYRYIIFGLDLRLDQVILVFLLIGWLPAFLTGKAKFHKVPLLIPALLFIVVGFVSSALYSNNRPASYQGTLLLFVYILMYIITVNVLLEHSDKIKGAAKFLLIVAVVHGFYAVIAFAANKAGVDFGGVNPGQVENAISLQGGFQEPNFLGAFTAAISLIFLALLTGRDKEISKFKLSVGVGLMILVLILTFTRTSWLGFIAGLVVLVFLQKPARNIFNPRAAAMVIIMLLLLIGIFLPFANALESNEIGKRLENILNFNVGSAEGRVRVEQLAIEKWKDAYLLGNGTLSLDAPEDLTSPVAKSWIYSSFLQALHDTGIVGLFFLLWFQLGVIVIAARGYIRTRDSFLRAVLAGLMAGSIEMTISSQTSSFLWLGFSWIFAGITVAVAQIASRETEAEGHLEPENKRQTSIQKCLQ